MAGFKIEMKQSGVKWLICESQDVTGVEQKKFFSKGILFVQTGQERKSPL